MFAVIVTICGVVSIFVTVWRGMSLRMESEINQTTNSFPNQEGGSMSSMLMLPPGNYGKLLMLDSARCPGCSCPGGCPYGAGDGWELFTCPFGPFVLEFPKRS